MNRRSNSKTKVASPLRIIPLGGVEEVGMNCTAVEYGNDIVVIDLGVGFPDWSLYGVDLVIPNVSYLKKNRKKIRGIFLTHGHMDHIGAIPYVIVDLGFPPIYTLEFAAELLKLRLKEFKLGKKVKIKTVNRGSTVRAGVFEASFFGISHGIPDSMGVALNTPTGLVAHTGDFKLDNTPYKDRLPEYGKIRDLGNRGVLLAMCDSTRAQHEGHSPSERDVTKVLDEAVRTTKGRMIAAIMSSYVWRAVQLIDMARKYNRKVFIAGRSLENSISIARRLGYIKVPKETFVSKRNFSKVPDDRILIMTTGTQGEDMASLARMARNEHKVIRVKKGDTIMLSASVIPGNERVVQELIDNLIKLGADVFHQAIMDVHAGGHGYQEDQKEMLKLLRPKFFMPIEGYQGFLLSHKKTAMSVGIPERNIIVARNGREVELTRQSWRLGKKYAAKPVLVSGSGVGDVGNIVLKDRERLGNNGVVIVVLNVDKKRKKLRENPQVVSRGFVFVKESKKLMSEISLVTKDVFQKKVKKIADPKEIKEKVTKDLEKLLYKRLEREPMVLVVVVY